MRRWLFAGGLVLALTSVASTQSTPPSDGTRSPTEISSNPLTAETRAKPDAGTKAEPSSKPDAGAKAEPSSKADAVTKSEPSSKPAAGTKLEASTKPAAGTKPEPSTEPSAGTISVPSAKPDAAKGSAKKSDAAAPKAATPKPTAAKHDPDGLEQCLRNWDAATHMTRGDWARVCRAIVTERRRRTATEQAKK